MNLKTFYNIEVYVSFHPDSLDGNLQAKVDKGDVKLQITRGGLVKVEVMTGMFEFQLVLYHFIRCPLPWVVGQLPRRSEAPLC